MKHIYAVNNQEELHSLQTIVQNFDPKLSAYFEFLKESFAVTDLPRCILWTDLETATQLISDIPLPAYTNEYRTVFCPDPEVWRSIYLRQLEQTDIPAVREYYRNNLTPNHVMQILGHEFVHHSSLFIDDFDSDHEKGVWFEEGMCEYISRKYFLTEREFQEESKVNTILVDTFQDTYGTHPLEDFGRSTYRNDYASIFFEYWRSFLAVESLVNAHGGDIHAVFCSYHKWQESNSPMTLEQWFGI